MTDCARKLKYMKLPPMGLEIRLSCAQCCLLYEITDNIVNIDVISNNGFHSCNMR